MQFGLLGPLVLADGDGGQLPVTGGRLRVLLAALLLQANTPVSWESLAEAVWDGVPPAAAARTLRSHVGRLRRVLGPEAGRIVTCDPGYQVCVQAGELDVTEFEQFCHQAGSALREGAWARASDAAARALRLWRGIPLLDVPSQVLRDGVVSRFEQLHLQALEDGGEADLHLERHEYLVPHLRELVGAHPLCEHFHAQLMVALARSGRRAEALEVFQQARHVLVDELGVEPGPELRDLHAQILAGDDVRPAVKPSTDQGPVLAAVTPAGDVPRQLPAAPGHFTGRGMELELLLGLVDEPQVATGGTVVISAIDGMAGVGKTALAVHAAHRLAHAFPDGQLFIDMHGYTQGHPPREPSEALDLLLRGLDVPAGRIPRDTEARAAFYRQHLAGTRTLIVLDNALDEAQVRPLLPGAPGCVVLVTSRRRLKGLDDARTLPLDLLPHDEAAALLGAVAGPGRAPAQDPLAGEIAELCDRLPLALRIAGALLRHRPAWSLANLAGRLRDQQRRVRALSDGERELGAVFDLSYTGLGSRSRLLFRRLGLVPGPDADAHAAAALLACDPQTATELLDSLVDHNLLVEHVPARYRLHDLIRAHAGALAEEDPADENRAALDRLLRYYAHTAQSASLPVARNPRPAPDGPAPAHAPTLIDADAARAWLRTERENLEAAASRALSLALDEHVVALAAGLAEILRADGPLARAVELHQAAGESAERRGRPAAHAAALTDLAIARRLSGDLPEAADAASRALEIYRAVGDRHGEALALVQVGLVRQSTGDLPRAGETFASALELFRMVGNRHGEANALHNLGLVRQSTGDLPGAADAASRALEIYRAVGNRHGEALALIRLGLVRQMTGDLPRAGEALALALQIFRAIGDLNAEAYALAELGDVRRLSGDPSAAGAALARALEIFRATGHRGNEAWALNRYAAAVAADGDVPRALTLYQQALTMNRELNKPDDEAISLEGIAEHHLARGDPAEGAAYLSQALEIFQRLGMHPDIERIHTRLADLATP